MAYLPPVNNIDSVGGAADGTFPTLVLPHGVSTSQLISLTSGAGASNAIYIFQKESGTTQGAYQVTTGKTFKAIGYYTMSTTGGASFFIFAQSTAAPSHASSVGSPPAGSVFFNASGTIASAGDAQYGSGWAPGTTANSKGIHYAPALGLEFTALYYPYFVSDGGAAFTIKLIGYEA